MAADSAGYMLARQIAAVSKEGTTDGFCSRGKDAKEKGGRRRE
jgi:hypothetical protein